LASTGPSAPPLWSKWWAIAGDPWIPAWRGWLDPERGLAVVDLTPRLDALEDHVGEAIPPRCRGWIARIPQGLGGEEALR